MKKAVLIPCYNEEITIEKVINDFKTELPDADIYVYDNNSTDNTAKIATEAGAIVKKEPKQGKGNVVQSMFEQIDADVYIMVDGDDTYNAKDVHKLIKPIINQDADMVVGDRIKNGDYKKENKRKFHYSGNYVVKFLVNRLFKMNNNDVMTGYRAFSKKFVKTIKLQTTHFEIETEITIESKLNNMKVIEVPINYSDRPKGSKSKLNTIKDGEKIISYVLQQYKNQNKQYKYSILKYIIVFILLITCYICTLTLTSTFDSKLIKENCKQSAQTLKQQWNEEYYGRLPIFIPYKQDIIIIDNPTDAIMVNTAYSIDSQTPFTSAMLGRKNYVKGLTTKENGDTNGTLKSSDKYDEYLPVDELVGILNDEPDESFEYIRYWHGYLIILRPLLLLFNINIIRIILLVTIAVLTVSVLALTYKRFGIKTTLIFFIGFLITETFYVGMSLQGAPIFIIMLIQTLLVLKRKRLSMLEIFITGSLTNFFDFLTAPVITLGIPLIAFCLIQQKENTNSTVKNLVIMIVKYSIVWGLGYGITWLAKWLIVGIFCNRDIFNIVLAQIKHRSFGTTKELTYAAEFIVLFANLFNGISIIIIPIAIIAYVMKTLYKLNKVNFKNTIIENIFINSIPYFVISLIPIIWSLVLKNHTYNHSFFTYRMMQVWVIAIGIIMFSIEEETKRSI